MNLAGGTRPGRPPRPCTQTRTTVSIIAPMSVKVGTFGALALLGLCAPGCVSETRAKADERSKTPRLVSDNSQECCRESVSTFFKHLKNPKPGQEYFSVAVKSADSDTAVWVDGLHCEGDTVKGKVVGRDSRLGRVVQFTAADVKDWMIVENGRTVGGLSLVR